MFVAFTDNHAGQDRPPSPVSRMPVVIIAATAIIKTIPTNEKAAAPKSCKATFLLALADGQEGHNYAEDDGKDYDGREQWCVAAEVVYGNEA